MPTARSLLAVCSLFVFVVGCEAPRAEATPPPAPHHVARVPHDGGARDASSPVVAAKHEVTQVRAPVDAAVREPTDWHADRSLRGAARVAQAKRSKQATVDDLFAKAGVGYPAKELLLRVYKKEGQLEVWAGDGVGRMARVATYGICAASGELGPKRAEGDLQVPEGFYTLSYFHPESRFHLAAHVDYPNRSDRIRGTEEPGGQILLHGSCASIGCIAMSDERMNELYLMAWATWRASGTRTHVHIFPARDVRALLADPALYEHHDFWREIDVGKRAFEATGRIPAVTIDRDGRYVVAEAP